MTESLADYIKAHSTANDTIYLPVARLSIVYADRISPVGFLSVELLRQDVQDECLRELRDRKPLFYMQDTAEVHRQLTGWGGDVLQARGGPARAV